MPLPENKVAKENKVITAGDDMIADGLQFQIDILSNTQSVMEGMRDSLDSLVSMFGDFIEQQNFLRDAQAEKSGAKDVSGATVAKDDEMFKNLKGGWFSTILLAGLAAYALGWDKYIRLTLLPKITVTFTKMFMAPIKWLDKTFFSAKPPKEMKVAKMKRGVQVKTWGTRISGFWDKITAPFRWLGNWIKNSPLVQKLKGMKFPKLSGGLSALKWVFMKALFPLFLALDLITGFVEGFKKTGPEDTRTRSERVIAGFKAGILKAVENFVVWPINALKDGLAWLMGKVGLDKVQEWLKSFDLIELFKKGFDPEMWKDFFDNLSLENLGAVLKLMVEDLWTATTTAFKNLINMFAPEGYETWGEWWEAKKAEWTESWNRGVDMVKNLVEELKGLPGKVWGMITKWFDDKIVALKEKVDNMKLAGKEFADFITKNMTDIIAKIKEKFIGWFHKLTFGVFKAEDPDTADLERAEEKAKLQSKIAEEQARIDRSKAGEDEYADFESMGIKRSERKIKEAQKKLDALNALEPKEEELKIEPNDDALFKGQNLTKTSAAQAHTSLLMAPITNTDNSQNTNVNINKKSTAVVNTIDTRSADKIMYTGTAGAVSW